MKPLSLLYSCIIIFVTCEIVSAFDLQFESRIFTLISTAPENIEYYDLDNDGIDELIFTDGDYLIVGNAAYENYYIYDSIFIKNNINSNPVIYPILLNNDEIYEFMLITTNSDSTYIDYIFIANDNTAIISQSMVIEGIYRNVLFGDINNDLHDDIILEVSKNSQSVLFSFINNLDSTVSDFSNIEIGSLSYLLSYNLYDLNNDNLNDLIVENHKDIPLDDFSNTTTYLNNGDEFIYHKDMKLGNKDIPNDISFSTVIDINGDNIEEYIIYQDSLYIYHIDDIGVFNLVNSVSVMISYLQDSSIVIEDLNNDNIKEIITSPGYYGISNSIYVYEMIGAFDFEVKNVYNVGSHLEFNLLNVNDDNYLDLVTSSFSSSTYFINKQDGTFIDHKDLIGHNGATHFEFVDLNNDGDKDLFYYSNRFYRVSIFENGVFNETYTYYNNEHYNFDLIELADIDNDDFLDVIIKSSYAEANVYPYVIHNTMYGFINDGSGRFSSLQELWTESYDDPSGVILTSLELFDFDNDNDMDIISFYPQDSLIVLINENNGNYDSSITTIYQGSQYVGMTTPSTYSQAIDINNDGFEDIIYSAITQGINILLHNGSEFENEYFLTLNGIPHNLKVVDLNQDLLKDLVFVISDEIFIMYNDGNNNFLNPIALEKYYRSYGGWGYQDITATKLNNSDKMSIVAISSTGEILLWTQNEQNDFIQKGIYTIGGASSVKPYDYNNDGFMDLILLGDSLFSLIQNTPNAPTDIQFDNLIDLIPSKFKISQNYPNPFNPSTTIEFHLPNRSHVKINVYNLLGQQVRELANQEFAAGNYKVTWDGTSSNGVQTSTGIYFYRIETDDYVETKKMMLLK